MNVIQIQAKVNSKMNDIEKKMVAAQEELMQYLVNHQISLIYGNNKQPYYSIK